MPYDDDFDNRIIDLTFVKKPEDEHPRYVCHLCGPADSVLFEVTDPKLLEFAGPDVIRYMCPTCGYLIDNVDPRIRRQERVSTITGAPNVMPRPIIEPVKAEAKDKLRGTAHSRIAEIDYDIDKLDLEDLQRQGFQLHREEVRSSVSGHSHVKQGERPPRARRIR